MSREISKRISKDYSKIDTEYYNLHHLIKLFPCGHGFGGHGCIRDKSGAAIGGGDVCRFKDIEGNYYRFLITPAIYEELIKNIVRPFGRSKPAKLTAKYDLKDFPASALDELKHRLFDKVICEPSDDDDDDDDDPIYWYHIHNDEYTWETEKMLTLPINDKYQLTFIAEQISIVARRYLNEDKDARVIKCIFPSVQFIYEFPEPWILDKIVSPWFGLNQMLIQSEYAWYYGRFGVFDTFEVDHCYTGLAD